MEGRLGTGTPYPSDMKLNTMALYMPYADKCDTTWPGIHQSVPQFSATEAPRAHEDMAAGSTSHLFTS